MNFKDIQEKQELYQKLQQLVKINKQSSHQEKQSVFRQLPNSFVEVPRFIRLKQNKSNKQEQKQQQTTITAEQLSKNLEIQQSQIVQINKQCFALAPSVKINNSSFYQQGIIYGMDISSMFAVKCLDLQLDSKILQLCSAPGNKSMYACDIYPNVKVVGVQINPKRANVMKSLIKKYKLDQRIQVIVQDATKYQTDSLFDRVLVDTQCTHEGSVKHLKSLLSNKNNLIIKSKKSSIRIFKNKNKNNYNKITIHILLNTIKRMIGQYKIFKRFLDPIKLSNLNDLQLSLIKNGFKNLKPGGIMVYSTCSIDKRQNQNIVQKFLEQNKQLAQLMDASQSLKDCELKFRKGILDKTVYFSPKLSMCGGMFISKIRKVKNIIFEKD